MGAIGRDPTFLKVAVVNEELDIDAGKICNYTTECKYYMYSCRYLRAIDNTTIVQIPFDNHDEAIEATRRGDVWGVVHFHKDFTDELMVRQSDGNYADNDTIENSRIGITLDWSSTSHRSMEYIPAIDPFIKLQCAHSFSFLYCRPADIAYVTKVIHRCLRRFQQGSSQCLLLRTWCWKSSCLVLGSRLRKEKPVFHRIHGSGHHSDNRLFHRRCADGCRVHHQRKQGLLDRSLVAGVTTTEIMIAHLVNQFTVLMGQTALVFVFMILVFQIPCIGSLTLAIFITLLQGMCGMSYGFVVSSLCDQETSAIHLSLGSFYPNLLLSGVLWPMEGMPVYLRYVSYFLPQTYAVESLRNIFARGWGFEREEVYFGVITSFAWICALISLSLIVIRVRKYTG